MADSDDEASRFRIYTTFDISSDTILNLLTGGADEYDIQERQGSSAQQICQHHRDTTEAGGDVHTALFLIFDRPEPRTRGVLLVNLKPYHGYPDAVRKPPDEASDSLGSLSIGNTDWFEEREAIVDEHPDLTPENRVALYELLPSGERGTFDEAVKAMNEGLQEVGIDQDDDDEEEEGDGGQAEGEMTSRRFHRAVHPESRELEEVMDQHQSYAQAEGLDEERFAVVDEQYRDKGALLVQVRPVKEFFYCTLPVAGEILGWVFVGFMTWEEARAGAV